MCPSTPRSGLFLEKTLIKYKFIAQHPPQVRPQSPRSHSHPSWPHSHPTRPTLSLPGLALTLMDLTVNEGAAAEAAVGDDVLGGALVRVARHVARTPAVPVAVLTPYRHK